MYRITSNRVKTSPREKETSIKPTTEEIGASRPKPAGIGTSRIILRLNSISKPPNRLGAINSEVATEAEAVGEVTLTDTAVEAEAEVEVEVADTSRTDVAEDKAREPSSLIIELI